MGVDGLEVEEGIALGDGGGEGESHFGQCAQAPVDAGTTSHAEKKTGGSPVKGVAYKGAEAPGVGLEYIPFVATQELDAAGRG